MKAGLCLRLHERGTLLRGDFAFDIIVVALAAIDKAARQDLHDAVGDGLNTFVILRRKRASSR